MAFAAKLAAQTDELINAVTSLDAKRDRQRFAALREASLRTLRTSSGLARTNQFLVAEQLEGLQEKFVVNGRDGLARELRRRLDYLQIPPHSSTAGAATDAGAPFSWTSPSHSLSSRWVPEILHLLLELSDRPVQESSLAALELCRPQPDGEPSAPPLRWEDIAREDGWADGDDPSLWANVDFCGSSDEDEANDEMPDAASDSEATSVSDGDTAQLQLRRILRGDPPPQPEPAPSLEAVVLSQSWRSAAPPEDSSGRPRKIVVSEIQVVREVLFMLQGHTTILFDSECAPVLTYQLADVAWDTYKALITSVAEAGRPLQPLRDFIAGRPETPLLQTLQDSIRRSLRAFDMRVSEVQSRYVAPKADVVVSVVAAVEELRPYLRPLHALSVTVRALRYQRRAHAFRCLELLFDAACQAQLQGDDAVYRVLGAVFCECFQVYLRPIRLWMEDGQLLPGDRVFFITESTIKFPLDQVWRSQFKLRRTQDGTLHAPRFLKPAVSRIFTTGKSVVVLKHLGRYQQARERWAAAAEPSLDFYHVCPAGLELAPFSETFGDAFDRWIRSKHHATSATLRRILFESCGLSTTLAALENVFMMADGAAGDAFASAIFAGIDKRTPRWHDRFTLTELVQESFSPSLDDPQRLTATLNSSAEPTPAADSPAGARPSVRQRLPQIKLRYRMAWPVQLIVSEESIAEYQKVFTLALQLRRAVYVLKGRHGRRLGDRGVVDQASGEHRAYLDLRSRLLWFCTAMQTYLTTLVFSPGALGVRQRLNTSDDVDAMIASHAAFVKALVEESCLGPKLGPIRECILDVLDLALQLEDSRRRHAAREAEEMREISRLSVAISSPAKSPGRGLPRTTTLRGRYVSSRAEDDGGGDDDGDDGYDRGHDVIPSGKPGTDGAAMEEDEKDYHETLLRISADLDRHLRFITGGLRGVARASGDRPAAKWDMLAEVLETGYNDR